MRTYAVLLGWSLGLVAGLVLSMAARGQFRLDVNMRHTIDLAPLATRARQHDR